MPATTAAGHIAFLRIELKVLSSLLTQEHFVRADGAKAASLHVFLLLSVPGARMSLTASASPSAEIANRDAEELGSDATW
jgi:hypothetical protein